MNVSSALKGESMAVKGRSRSARRAELGLKYGLLGLTVLEVVIFASLPETRDAFTSIANIRGLVSNQAVLLLLALSFTVPLIAGEFDLSIGGTYALTSVVFAGLMSTASLPLTGGPSFPVVVSGILALLVPMGVGLANGLLVTRGAIDALICTLGTGIVAGGLVLWYSGGGSISEGLPSSLTDFGTGAIAGVPVPALVLLLVGVLVWFLLEHTRYGRELAAIGSNRRAAYLVGIRVDRVVLISFVIGGLLAGLAGELQVARQGTGVPSTGLEQIIAAFAATYLGANVIKPGHFNVLGTAIGLLFVAVLVNGLSILGVDSWVQPVVYGSSLVAAMTLSATFRRRISGA